jgi:hypothetical protein
MPVLEAATMAVKDFNAQDMIVDKYSRANSFGDRQRWLYQPELVDIHKERYKRELFLRSKFQLIREQLDEATNLRQNWDSYNAEPPNHQAQNLAAGVLTFLETNSIAPSRLVPSAEGGVAFCFVESNRYADIECLNTGEILAVIYEGNNDPIVWQVTSQNQALQETVERIRGHIAA